MTALLLAAALSFAGPSGARLSDAGPIPAIPDGPLMAARATGLADGYRAVADAPGDWHSLALEHDSTLTWPRRTTVYASCGGHEVRATDLFAMTPPLDQRIIHLGGAQMELDPDRLWRRRFRKGPVCTVLFARFPVDSCRGGITGMRIVTEGR